MTETQNGVPGTDTAGQRGLCIYGVKGCGKSVLAASLHDDLASHGRVSALFCFWGQSESLKKCVNMLSTLVWQLMKKIPENDFDKVASHIMSDLPVSVPNLLAALDMAVEAIKQPVHLIVDGIDESSDDWSHRDIGGLNVVSQLSTKHTNIRILVLGREPSIRPLLRVFPGFEITEELIRDDMNRFIASELDHVTSITTDELRSEVRAELLEKAGAIFLWVKLVVAELRRCYSVAEIRSTLKHLPQSLDEEYYRAFLQLAKRLAGVARVSIGSTYPQLRRVRSLFSLIVAAAEPLTLGELQHAYAVSVAPDPSHDWKDHLLASDGIIIACGDFIHVSSNKVYLGHTSVEEFLTRPAGQWKAQPDIEYFRLNVAECHQAVGMTCVDYLMLTDWGYPLSDDSFISLSQAHPFLLYAHKYAAYHFLQADSPNPDQLRKLDAFFSSNGFCKWVEYLVLHVFHDFTAAEYWIDLFQFSEWYETARRITDPSLLELLARRFAEELARRQLSYGVDDARTASWELIGNLATSWVFLDPKIQQTLVEPLDGPRYVAELGEDEDESTLDANISADSAMAAVGTLRGSSASTRPEVIAQQIHQISAMSNLPSRISPLQYASILFKVPMWMRCVAIQLDPAEMLFNAFLSASHKLPVLVVIVLSVFYRNIGRNGQGKQLCAIAVDRTKGQGTFEEATALGFMGDMERRDGDKQSCESYFRRSVEISRKLPRRLHNEVLMSNVTCALSGYLLRYGPEDEGVDLSNQLAERLSTPGPPSGSKWETYIRQSPIGATLRAVVFKILAKNLTEKGHCQEGMDILNKAVRCLRPSLGAANSSILELQIQKGWILHRSSKYYEAIAVWRDVVANFGSNQDEAFPALWGEAQSLVKLGRYDEVAGLLTAAKRHHAVTTARGWRVVSNLCDILHEQKRYDLARKEITKLDFTLNVHGLGMEEIVRIFTSFYRVMWGEEARQYTAGSAEEGQMGKFNIWLSNFITQQENGKKGKKELPLRNLVGISCALINLGRPGNAEQLLELVVPRLGSREASSLDDNSETLGQLAFFLEARTDDEATAAMFTRYTVSCKKVYGSKRSATHFAFECLAFAHLKCGKPHAAADAFKRVSEYAKGVHIRGSKIDGLDWAEVGA